MVKFFLVLSFLLAASLSVNAQKHDEKLLKNIQVVLDATMKNDFKTTLDYTCPEIFTLASREELLQAFEQAFNQEEMKMTITGISLDTIFPPFVYNKQTHVVIKYNMSMNIQFDEPIDSSFLDILLPLMDEHFGKDATTTLTADNTLGIQTKSKMIATRKDASTDWCLLNYDSTKALMEMLFDKALIKKIESY